MCLTAVELNPGWKPILLNPWMFMVQQSWKVKKLSIILAANIWYFAPVGSILHVVKTLLRTWFALLRSKTISLLADVTAHSIRTALRQPQVSGLYHLAAKGEISWYGYASFVLDIVRQAGIKLKVAPESVLPVTTDAFSQPARRPGNSRLDTRKIESTFDLTLPLWQTGVARMLTEILEEQLWPNVKVSF